MALDALRCDHLAPLGFKGLTQRRIWQKCNMTYAGWC